MQITVGTNPVRLDNPKAGRHAPQTIRLRDASGDILLGRSNAVTAATDPATDGWPIKSTDTQPHVFEVPPTQELWAVVAAGTQTVEVF